MRRLLPAASVVVALVIGLVLPGAALAQGPTVRTIASGLDNPRGIVVGPSGSVFVAEGGRGGDGPCFPGPEGGDVCVGETGAITRIWKGHQGRIVEGLPSVAPESGEGAIGPNDLAFHGFGNLYVSIGLGADPAIRDTPGAPAFAQDFATLAKVNLWRGTWQTVADLGQYESDNDPDGGVPDSNPFGLLSTPRGIVATDAGGNDLLFVRHGKISTLAVFPDREVPPPFPGAPDPFPMQAVPTSVVRGPDGAFYVGQLTGFPFPVGGANVWRVVPGKAPTVYASGFTNIIDIAFGRDGSLYVLEIAHNGLGSGDPTGALIKVKRNGTRETILSEGLIAPGGFALGARGKIYVSNCGVCAGGGEVLEVSTGH